MLKASSMANIRPTFNRHTYVFYNSILENEEYKTQPFILCSYLHYCKINKNVLKNETRSNKEDMPSNYLSNFKFNDNYLNFLDVKFIPLGNSGCCINHKDMDINLVVYWINQLSFAYIGCMPIQRTGLNHILK